jgi:hypothetical protein
VDVPEKPVPVLEPVKPEPLLLPVKPEPLLLPVKPEPLLLPEKPEPLLEPLFPMLWAATGRLQNPHAAIARSVVATQPHLR